ncbi:MAG: DEAD/DEAH box helicase family protein [Verrucomicrobiota bacterium]
MATPENQARDEIDAKLTAAGWVIQDRGAINLDAAMGIAVREFPLKPGHGIADYLLYVDAEGLGVIEAKPSGATLTSAEAQARRYSEGLPDDLNAHHRPLPFVYQASGTEIHFTNFLEENPRARDVFHFHTPAGLLEISNQGQRQLRTLVRDMPAIADGILWSVQRTTIGNLEESFAFGRPRSLVQMTMGSGKTFTAVNFCYRLLKFANARRVLFLVDRKNLGKQADSEFQNFVPPDDPRRFGDIYSINRLKSNTLRDSDQVVITTIQRLYSILQGEEEFEGDEEQSMFETGEDTFATEPKPVAFNPKVPIENFDVIIVDECHRSIYGLWRQVLEYFDAFIVGLTATPSKQTIAFFRKNLVMEYDHGKAVTDGVNVDFDVWRIRTQITEQGSKLVKDPHIFIPIRDRQTRAKRYEALSEDIIYAGNELDRSVVSEDQIRTVLEEIRDKVFPTAFPGRQEVPKTLVLAKTDSHAEDIVKLCREVFGQGNDFCEKITYRTGFVKVPVYEIQPDGTQLEVGHKWEKTSSLGPDEVLANFRNTYSPRIAVTVDMIATGTDVKSIEALLFLRDVRSAGFFEQMKGRGVRVIEAEKLREVSPSAKAKDHFIIIDAVGVCESKKSYTSPSNVQPGVSLKKLLDHVAMGGTHPDALSTLSSRLARLERQLTPEQKTELRDLANGRPLADLAGKLAEAVDPDAQIQRARKDHQLSAKQDPTPAQIEAAAKAMRKAAAKPFLAPALRKRLLEIRQQLDQIIDELSDDKILHSNYDAASEERARSLVTSFETWLRTHKDEIDALEVFYGIRHGKLTFADIKQLAAEIKKPPLNLTVDALWQAYARLEKSAAKATGERQLTDLVSLIRHALRHDVPPPTSVAQDEGPFAGEPDELVPFSDRIQERYLHWLAVQEQQGAEFTDEQSRWLDAFARVIATSLHFEEELFDYDPWLSAQGGLGRAHQLFGANLRPLIDDLNDSLVA